MPISAPAALQLAQDLLGPEAPAVTVQLAASLIVNRVKQDEAEQANEIPTGDEARAAIQARPCECVRCGGCRGQGIIWIPDRMGLGMDEPERCDDCDGSGITEVCDCCAELSEFDEASSERA